VRVSKWGFFFDEGGARSFYVGDTSVSPKFQHEYIRAVTVSRSLWTLYTLCHCTILSNTHTEVSCQWRFESTSFLTYAATLKLQLVRWTVVVLTAGKSVLLIQPQNGSHTKMCGSRRKHRVSVVGYRPCFFRCLATAASSRYAIPAFSHYVTVLSKRTGVSQSLRISTVWQIISINSNITTSDFYSKMYLFIRCKIMKASSFRFCPGFLLR
jgi:hypothetical protein